MNEILTALNQIAHPEEEIYLVGGCVRDLMLGRPTKDLDLVTNANPRRLASRVARRLGGMPFALHTELRAYRIVPRKGTSGLPVDILPLAGTIEEDLVQRDFTINALALPLPVDVAHPEAQVIDPAGGIADLRAGRLRHVRDDVFTSDAVRLLRAVRIAAGLGFAIAPETEALVREHAELLLGAAVERVRDELFLLLALPNAASHLGRLDDLGLLRTIFPEIEGLKGLQQNANHHLEAWAHTLEAVRQCEPLLSGEGLPEDVGTRVKSILSQPACPPRSRAALLLLATLLHDVAKPQTRGVTASGIITFLGHDAAGAEVAQEIATRLRLSNREIKAVAAMVRGHLAPGFLSLEEPPSPRHRYRYFRDMGDSVVDALLLSLADRLAARGTWAREEQIERHQNFVVEMLRLYFEGAPVARPVVPARGRELMRVTGLSQGPELGALMDALLEAVAAGEVNTREDALEFAREWRVPGEAPSEV